MICISSYRFVQQEFANKLLVDEGDEENVSTSLSHHPQYTNVIGVLQRDKVLQQIKVKTGILTGVLTLSLQQDSSLLPATVCLLVTLSRDVFEVRKVFLLLTAPGSPCCLMRVVELFYCIATFFYIRWTGEFLPQRYTQHNFDQSFVLPGRYHYKVYYVLTVFEQPSLTPDHRYDSSCVSHDVLSW